MQRFSIIFSLFSALIFLGSCQSSESLTDDETPVVIEADQPRVSLTFILSEDGKNGNRFYQKASDYFHLHATDKTDNVVYTCQSLEQVKDYLEHFSQPLSLINLVTHGNPWQGLSVPVLENGKRCSYSNLAAALDNGEISAIKSAAIDQNTQVNVISCGIGQDKRLVALLKRLFGTEVHASEYYVNFSESLEKYHSKFYFTTSKYEYADGNIIPNRLSQKYPDDNLDWKAAYANEVDEAEGPFHYKFRMAVNWTVIFPNKKERETVQSEATLVEWMKTQAALSRSLEEMNLTFNEFQWSYFPLEIDGQIALKVRGFCNVDGVMVKI